MNKNSQVLSFTHGLHADYSNSIDWSCFHQHSNEIEMAFHPKCPISYRFGGRLEEVGAEETIMYWGAIPHQATAIPANDICYFLTVPISVFAQMNLPQEFVRRILSGEIMREKDQTLREVDLLMFESWKYADFTRDENLRKSFVFWVQFRLIRFASNTETAPVSPGNNNRNISRRNFENKKVYVKVKRDDAIECMYDYVTNNYLKDICVEDVARSAGLNSNYANTFFREHTGTSIGRFINMLRIYKSQSLLLTTDLKVVDVSLESGFRTLGNFYKMFESNVGMSPSRYRSQHMPTIQA